MAASIPVARLHLKEAGFVSGASPANARRVDPRLFAPAPRFGRSPTGVLTLPLLMVALFASADRQTPETAAPRKPSPEVMTVKISTPPPQPPSMDLLEIPHDRARRLNAAVPFSSAPNPAARPFHFRGNEADRLRAIDCLASAEYYEAGADPDGQRAVAQVVLNRVRHPAFPATVCGVVYQGSERATGCQFTFTCDGVLARQPVPWLWDKAREIAKQALDGSVYAAIGLSTHYHTDWVVPVWSDSLDKVTSVHTHLFFRWRGAWGRPGAFQKAVATAEPAEPKLAAISPWHKVASDQAALASVNEAIDASAPGSRPSATTLAGIDLRGSELRLVHPQGDAFGFLLPHAYPGAFGLLAFDVCRGRAFCKIMGWTDPAAIPKGFPIPFDAQRRMAFLYVHDAKRHAEIIAWNCQIFPRTNPSECLGNQLTQWDAVQRVAGTAL